MPPRPLYPANAWSRVLRRGLGACSWMVLALTLSACAADKLASLTAFGEPADLAAAPAISFDGMPADELVHAGKTYFRAADYGNAQRAYQKAVELRPDDAEAWLGLAASYDRLGRFDQANVAYARLHGLIGETTVYYNNRGFSYLLQGRGDDAARSFQRALALDPTNAVAANNLAMLRRYAEKKRS